MFSMSKVFLINIGANKSHGSIARSPIFPDDQFVYVSFPSKAARGVCPYPHEAHIFVLLARRIWIRIGKVLLMGIILVILGLLL